MSWTLDKARNIWKCSIFSELNAGAINNLAEYGEPYSPYDSRFDHDFYDKVDFAKVVVEMPQSEVMYNGYGQAITANSFPLVNRFLTDPLSFPTGTYNFSDLVRFKFANGGEDGLRGERWINTNFYGWGSHNPQPGDLHWSDAAYVHGSVSLALKLNTKFIYSQTLRRVEAEIVAGKDNWDFESANLPKWLNAAVATVLGPTHNNLKKPIEIIFSGSGKRSVVERQTQASPKPLW